MDKEKVLKPEPLMEAEWDWDTQEFTGNKHQIQEEKYDYVYICESCGNKIFLDNYCSKCGQKLI